MADLKTIKLTPKQELLAHKYLELGTQVAAYRAAGYSTNMSVDKQYIKASLLFKKGGKVWKRVEQLRDEALADQKLDLREVLRELMRIAFFDLRMVFDKNDNLIPINELSDDAAACLSGVEIDALYEGSGQDRIQIGQTKKIKTVAKDKALDMLMRHLGAYKEEPTQQNNIQINITHAGD